MDVVNVNIVSVLSRVIGEVSAVRDALNTVGTQPTDNQQLKAEVAALASEIEALRDFASAILQSTTV
jgi:cell division protein FtsB